MSEHYWEVIYRCSDGSTGAQFVTSREDAETTRDLLLGKRDDSDVRPYFTWVRPIGTEVISADIVRREGSMTFPKPPVLFGKKSSWAMENCGFLCSNMGLSAVGISLSPAILFYSVLEVGDRLGILVPIDARFEATRATSEFLRIHSAEQDHKKSMALIVERLALQSLAGKLDLITPRLLLQESAREMGYEIEVGLNMVGLSIATVLSRAEQREHEELLSDEAPVINFAAAATEQYAVVIEALDCVDDSNRFPTEAIAQCAATALDLQRRGLSLANNEIDLREYFLLIPPWLKDAVNIYVRQL
jgi:hypothetical protein